MLISFWLKNNSMAFIESQKEFQLDLQEETFPVVISLSDVLSSFNICTNFFTDFHK